VNRQDLQLEELTVPESIRLTLHRLDLVIGPCSSFSSILD
jgi:hypothetical protein